MGHLRPAKFAFETYAPTGELFTVTVFPCEMIYFGERGKVGWVGITESREIKLGKKYAKLKLCAIMAIR